VLVRVHSPFASYPFSMMTLPDGRKWSVPRKVSQNSNAM